MKAVLLTTLAFAAFGLAACDEEASKPTAPPPVSKATWREVEQAVGCDSKLTDEKKRDIFTRDYDGRQMTWSGSVKASYGEILSSDSKGNEGGTFRVYGLPDLTEGEPVTIRFTLTGNDNDCLGFSGRDGVVLSHNAFKFPVSDVTLDQAYNQLTGPEFEDKVHQHQVTWSGTVDDTMIDEREGDVVFVHTDIFKGNDLTTANNRFMVKLAKGQSAYDLEKGKPITVRFVVRSNDFSGDQGVIVTPVNG
jgi:hypothetical protein